MKAKVSVESLEGRGFHPAKEDLGAGGGVSVHVRNRVQPV